MDATPCSNTSSGVRHPKVRRGRRLSASAADRISCSENVLAGRSDPTTALVSGTVPGRDGAGPLGIEAHPPPAVGAPTARTLPSSPRIRSTSSSSEGSGSARKAR